MRKLEAYSTFGDFGNRPAERAVRSGSPTRAPMDDARVFLGSGGGDSIDTAAKIARRHWVLSGQPERVHLISPHAGLPRHARLRDVASAASRPTRPTGARWSREISTVPFDSLPALEAEIRRVGPDRVAAFFCEPVIGAGGVHPPPTGYIEGVADLCAEHGVLLVIDSRDLRLRPARHLVRRSSAGRTCART